ncbi:MAG: DUF5596 domain-containing protein [Victivallales bacterium]|nr:DUF5596 domain-containing protein [Victivallales bacterium]
MEYTLEEVFTACGGNPSEAPLEGSTWAEAMASFPADGLKFLDESIWKKAREQVGFSAELDEQLERVAAKIKVDPVLSRLLWYVYRYYTYPVETTKGSFGGCPLPIQLGEEDKHLFYLFCALGFIPDVWKYHKSIGIPEEITYNTIRKFKEHGETYNKAEMGYIGMTSGRLYWLSHYMHIPMFRLGRLEYWLQHSNLRYYVWRRESDKLTVAFPDPEVIVTQEGYPRSSADDQNAPTWTTQYEVTATEVKGTPFLPNGFLSPKTVTLPRSEFKLIFQPKDVVAAMHIPFGGGLTPQKARESLGAVKPFFDTYFPEMRVKLIQCRSWIFGNHLEKVLAPDANLLDLQHNIYLMACASGHYDGLGFLFPNFNPQNVDWDKMPQDNSLRRRIVAHFKNGGFWRLGSMFFVPEDIAEYGTHPYLRRWQNAGL